MHKKIKMLLSAVILSATMTGINPMPAVPNTVITVEAAAKPALNKKSATLAAGSILRICQVRLSVMQRQANTL